MQESFCSERTKMPELPEVETTRRGLERHLIGRSVVAIKAKQINMRRPLVPTHLRANLVGRKFSYARRKGKYLLLDIADGSLLVHLGMSGRLQVTSKHTETQRHTHLILVLDNGCELRFTDPRRFGFAHYLEVGEEENDPSLLRLGIEPVSDDLIDCLPPMYRTSLAPIKSLLLDQKRVSGIGNIYATEALWRSRIHPSRPGARISVDRLKHLAGSVQDVLNEAIEQGGTTLKDFAAPDGAKGYFAVRLAVYGKEGRPCPRCQKALVRKVIGGRSTTYCTGCQR